MAQAFQKFDFASAMSPAPELRIRPSAQCKLVGAFGKIIRRNEPSGAWFRTIRHNRTRVASSRRTVSMPVS